MSEKYLAASPNARRAMRSSAIMGMVFLVIAALVSFAAVAPAQGATEQPDQAAALESGVTVSGQQADVLHAGQALDTQASVDGPQVGVAVPGDVLNGVKIRFRPKGSHKPVSINDDGHGTQNVAHLYYNGKSSQFQLRKASDNSYYFYFYQHFKNAEPKTDGDCVLDVERTKNDDSYMNEGQVIHITGKGTATNKQWRLIPQNDGSYFIQNVRSRLYMSLEDLSKPKENNNKLIQRETPLKWEIEIVSGDNERLQSIKKYDSLNFTYEDGKNVGSANVDTSDSITSLNWMGALPETLKITDISIPGTHDVGTCYIHTDQDGKGDQRYYIDEIMNAGVRHLDLRTGLNGNTVRIIHSDAHCLNRDGSELTMYQVLDWIDAFLNANPTETIILQVKMDKNGAECERKTYAILEERARRTDGKIWAGDHVPTLKEARGKIIVISRLNPDSLQTTTPFQLDNGLLWGLECHEWKDSKDKATALTASGSNYEVWTQDNWNHGAGGKKPYIEASLYGNQDDRYTNSTLARYDQAKMLGKDAWVFNYTSCSDGSDTPFKNSKEIHQWLYDRSDYNSNDKLVCSDTFTGVMAFDYVDELMAKHIYQTNFNRQYVTIHGINMGGIDINNPLTIYVGENETGGPEYKLINSDTTKSIIKAHFNVDNYRIKVADGGGFLTEQKTSITDQSELNTAVEAFKYDVRSNHVPTDVYVHLETIEPCSDDAHMWDDGVITMPPTCKDEGVKTSTCAKCGSTKTEVLDPDPTAHVTYTEEDGTSNSATCTEGGRQTQYVICSLCNEVVKTKRVATEPLGHTWGDSIYTWSDDHSTATATHVCSRCKKEESETVDATYRVLEESTCEGEGSTVYNADFANEDFEMQEATVSNVALGHDWGEPAYAWSDDHSTATATHVCARCGEEGSETVDATSRVLVESTCEGEGSTGFSADFASDGFEMQEAKVSIPALGHDWGEPAYAWSDDHSTATATHVCARCGEEESETVDATYRVLVESTCEDVGFGLYDADFKDESFDTQEVASKVPALGHDWDEGAVTTAPTTTAPGVKTFTCKRCGTTKTEEVPALSPASSTVMVGASYSVGGQSYKVTSGDAVAFAKAKNAKSVKVPDTVTLADGKVYKVTEISAKAFAGSKIRTVTIGKNVAKLAKGAFSKSAATKLIVKTKKLKKASVKGSLKGSKIKTVKVKVGSKKANKKYKKKYKKIFKKKICGKKVKVR